MGSSFSEITPTASDITALVASTPVVAGIHELDNQPPITELLTQ